MSQPVSNNNAISNDDLTSEPNIGTASSNHPLPQTSVQYRAYLSKVKRRSFMIRFSQLLLLLVFLGGWELSANMLWVDPMLTSKPSQMFQSLSTLLSDGNILYHTWVTAKETVISDEERNKFYIIPSVFNQKVVELVQEQVIKAAIATNVARRIPREYR